MERLIKELGENFNLSGKEQIILESLLNQKLSAEKISRITKIPLGRIYNYLNSLARQKLIERSEKKPYVYSIEKLDSNIAEFLRLQFDNMVEKQNKIMNLMENRSKNFDEIDVVTNGDEFSFRTVQLVRESKYIKNVVRHGSVPFTLYPENIRDFVMVRNAVVENRSTLSHTTPEMTLMLYRTHNDAYRKGKEMEYVVESSALKFHFGLIKRKFGRKFHANMLNEIKRRLNSYNVKIHVLDEFTTLQTLITNKKVFLSIIHLGHTHGIIIMNDATVGLYNEYFNELRERCKPIDLYI